MSGFIERNDAYDWEMGILEMQSICAWTGGLLQYIIDGTLSTRASPGFRSSFDLWFPQKSRLLFVNSWRVRFCAETSYRKKTEKLEEKSLHAVEAIQSEIELRV